MISEEPLFVIRNESCVLGGINSCFLSIFLPRLKNTILDSCLLNLPPLFSEKPGFNSRFIDGIRIELFSSIIAERQERDLERGHSSKEPRMAARSTRNIPSIVQVNPFHVKKVDDHSSRMREGNAVRLILRLHAFPHVL